MAHSLVEGVYVACQLASSLSGSKALQKPSGIPLLSREIRTGEWILESGL